MTVFPLWGRNPDSKRKELIDRRKRKLTEMTVLTDRLFLYWLLFLTDSLFCNFHTGTLAGIVDFSTILAKPVKGTANNNVHSYTTDMIHVLTLYTPNWPNVSNVLFQMATWPPSTPLCSCEMLLLKTYDSIIRIISTR